MRDEYVADVGDFGKYLLLRKLHDLRGGKVRIGVNWYYNRKPAGAFDYLLNKKSLVYQNLDALLFQELNRIASMRNVLLAEIASGAALPKFPKPFIHYLKHIPYESLTAAARKNDRERWFEESIKHLNEADIIFLDPDNGISPPSKKKTQVGAVKFAFKDEIMQYYDRGKSIIVYQCRPFKSDAEIKTYFDKFVKSVTDSKKDVLILKFKIFRIRYYILIPQPGHVGLFRELRDKLTSDPYDFLFEPFDLG